ncbi:hypothetical protein EXW58_26620 (plasmid) [Bacillus mycoides]|nr:hypothetical protein EXW58_26620 [Bacillus mycoides]
MNLKFNKTVLGLLSGIFLTMTVSNAAVAETDPVNEKASMADNLRQDIRNGLLKYISYQYDSVNGSLWWTNQ